MDSNKNLNMKQTYIGIEEAKTLSSRVNSFYYELKKVFEADFKSRNVTLERAVIELSHYHISKIVMGDGQPTIYDQMTADHFQKHFGARLEHAKSWSIFWTFAVFCFWKERYEDIYSRDFIGIISRANPKTHTKKSAEVRKVRKKSVREHLISMIDSSGLPPYINKRLKKLVKIGSLPNEESVELRVAMAQNDLSALDQKACYE